MPGPRTKKPTAGKKVKKMCHYCVNQKVVDYTDVNTLKRFISSYMKIAQRRRSGLCALHQRKAARAIKQARQMALMPYIPS